MQRIKELKSFVVKNFNVLEISHFERLYNQIDEKLKGVFNYQFRMHPAINEVINPDLCDEYYIYNITNSHIVIKYDEDFVIDDYPAVSDYKDDRIDKDVYSSGIAFLIRHIERLVTITRGGNINPKPPSLIMDTSQFDIYLANNKWSHVQMTESDAYGVFMRSFGMLSFINNVDAVYDILKKFYDFKIAYQLVSYIDEEANMPLPYGESLTCEDVDDNPEFF